MIYKKNADGTDMLDENGNPIPDENANKNNEPDSAVADALKNVVAELTEMRAINAAQKKLLEDKAAAEALAANPPAQPDAETEKVKSIVKELLNEDKSSLAQANKKAAFDKFIAENKEFHPENDQFGLKRQALSDKFNMFNTSGLTEVGQFYNVIRDAHRLLPGNDKQAETYKEIPNPYSVTPTPQNNPPSTNPDELSAQEKKIMVDNGWTKEKLLKLKANHPDLYSDLMSHVRV